MTTPRYRTAVARIFAGHSAEAILNGSIDHACLIIEEGFNAAESQVLLLTHRLDTRCYEQPAVLAAARQFLMKGDTTLRVLIEDETAAIECDHVVRDLMEAGGDRAQFNVVDADVIEAYRYNFMVVDQKGYRYEADRRQPTAVVAGGEKNRANTIRLTEIFNSIEKDHSRPLVVGAA